jgi:hypothetical protein
MLSPLVYRQEALISGGSAAEPLYRHALPGRVAPWGAIWLLEWVGVEHMLRCPRLRRGSLRLISRGLIRPWGQRPSCEHSGAKHRSTISTAPRGLVELMRHVLSFSGGLICNLGGYL